MVRAISFFVQGFMTKARIPAFLDELAYILPQQFSARSVKWQGAPSYFQPVCGNRAIRQPNGVNYTTVAGSIQIKRLYRRSDLLPPHAAASGVVPGTGLPR